MISCDVYDNIRSIIIMIMLIFFRISKQQSNWSHSGWCTWSSHFNHHPPGSNSCHRSNYEVSEQKQKGTYSRYPHNWVMVS